MAACRSHRQPAAPARTAKAAPRSSTQYPALHPTLTTTPVASALTTSALTAAAVATTSLSPLP